MQNAEFNDPRLAQIYEVCSPWSESDQFFLDWADEAPYSRLLDLGCGTGQITLALAKAGHQVTGVDPARASLDFAQAKLGAEQVTWICGTSVDAPAAAFDTALMTNHVAQFITGDAEWQALLADLNRALVPGGRLIFESRDPAARGWEKWNPADSRERIILPVGAVDIWTEVIEVAGENVTFIHHYTFSDTTLRNSLPMQATFPKRSGQASSTASVLPGCAEYSSNPYEHDEEVLSRSTLRFRPEATLRGTLNAAGFAVKAIYGGWQQQEVGKGDGEFIVVANKK